MTRLTRALVAALLALPAAVLFGPAALELMGSYCQIDPCALAKKVVGPVLVINGEHDTQVSAKKDWSTLFTGYPREIRSP